MIWIMIIQFIPQSGNLCQTGLFLISRSSLNIPVFSVPELVLLKRLKVLQLCRIILDAVLTVSLLHKAK